MQMWPHHSPPKATSFPALHSPRGVTLLSVAQWCWDQAASSLAGREQCLTLTASESVPWKVVCPSSPSPCRSLGIQSHWDGEEGRLESALKRSQTSASLAATSLCSPHASDTDLALRLWRAGGQCKSQGIKKFADCSILALPANTYPACLLRARSCTCSPPLRIRSWRRKNTSGVTQSILPQRQRMGQHFSTGNL